MHAVRRWVVTVLVAALLLSGGAVYAATRTGHAGTAYLTATVARGTVAQTVAATGTVQPAATLQLSFGGATAQGGTGTGTGSSGGGGGRTVSSGAAVVTSLTAQVGQQVAAGTPLATVDASAAQAQLAAAQSQLGSAQARQAAEPAGTSAAVLDADAAAVAQAEQQVQSAQAAVNATTITAPVDGMVTAVALTVGLAPTSPAITMQTGALAAVAQVSESDVASLSAGQKAQVTFPALSTTVDGTVAALPTSASSSSPGAAVTFPVTVTLAQPPAHLLPGMSAQISIVIAQRDGVLYVPTSALQGTATAPTVQVLQGGTPVSRPVEIGLSTGSTTEIVAGLSPGQTVVTGLVNPTTSTTSTTPSRLGGGGLGGGGLRGGLGGGGGGGGPRGGGGAGGGAAGGG